MAHYCIRYAKYNGRFQPCIPLSDIKHVTSSPTAFPQNIGQLEHILKHDNLLQNEDSFLLDIWTPETEGTKPVLFWIHGGSFVAGSSGDNQNDASNLAQNADIIVVSVTYRIGFLGTSYFPNIAQKNCGFHDIVTALEWTHTHISSFGGDPTNITVGGQSSGAWYAMAIHTAPKLQHLFQKTMLFSWPGTMRAISEQTATEISNKFFESIPDYKTVPIEQILAAQKIIGKQNKRKYKFNVPLMPTIENGYISDDFYRDCAKINKKIYLQYTSDECGVYVHHYPIYKNMPPLPVSLFLKRYCPERPYKQLRKIRKQTKDTYFAVLQLTSDKLFQEPARKIAEIVGENATLYEFSYPTNTERIKCCHCFDLPFIFGCIDNWKTSKLFDGCDISDMKKESFALQQRIKKFIY